MNSTFTRALIGFLTLTFGLSLMAFTALWAIDSFGGGVWWASLVIVLGALVVEAGIYGSTLHDPVKDWIREPALEKERTARAERDGRVPYVRD